MGNKKGYVPSDESKEKTSASLKEAYATGRRGRRVGYHPSDEAVQKQSESLKQAYAEGRAKLSGAALAAKLAPKKPEAEKKARKLETQRIWRANNPEKMAAYKQKYTPESYGLTNKQYEAQSRAQNDLCAVCKRPQQNGFRLAIDHDHNCCPERAACDKCRRGLLCTNCNTLLGSAHDSVEILQQAISYLNSFKKEKQCQTHPPSGAK
jgi:Recombination endonuclease VII